MINTNDYETREDLEKVMYQIHRDQLVQLMHSKYGIIKSDVEQMLSLIQYPFANKCAALDRHLLDCRSYRKTCWTSSSYMFRYEKCLSTYSR